MIRQVLINTPDASDAEIADFIHHKGREIKNPKTSFMACLSAVVVGAMQGHRMALYRQQRQKEQEQHEADLRCEFEKTVQCSEFWLGKLEQHLAGRTVDPPQPSRMLRHFSGPTFLCWRRDSNSEFNALCKESLNVVWRCIEEDR
jgi:hypothetical protein